MNKIELIKEAIEKADNLQSKMDEVAWSVPALSSLRIRHLMNNLGAISTRYLECGVHIGGLFCSTIRNNHNLELAIANDNFASDEGSDNPAYPRFEANVQKCFQPPLSYALIKGDTFAISVQDEMNLGVFRDIDLYCFDADHSYESQRKAVTHFLPSMADEFIFCVDDFDWDDVQRGTRDGLAEANVEILFEKIFKGNNHDNESWWNGFAIFLLKKKS